MIGDSLFVTGMQRAGTTLLQKLLDAQPGISVLSQPFPLLFVEAKRELLRSLGDGDERYPLGHRFIEDRYEPGSFAAFLAGFRPDSEWVRARFESMRDYTGQYTRFSPATLEQALADLPAGGDLAAVVASLWRSLGRREATIWGGKETLGEELLPHLLDRGCRCVLILRDPRDVLASLDLGSGADFAGRPKPVLFDLRNWRKSVAYALHLEGRPGFHWLRYEDLVGDPIRSLDELAARLRLPGPPPEGWSLQPRTPDGSAWRGNSSHGERPRVDGSSVGAHRGRLSPAVVAYVEATCGPELAALGYDAPPAVSPVATIAGFHDPFDGVRPELAGYSTRPENVAAEVRRLALLAEPEPPDATAWFLFPGVHGRLQPHRQP